MEKKYILLAEDNEDDVSLTQIAFKKCQVPHELVVAWDGQEAVDFLFGQGKYAGRDTARKPAVILLDLKLPYLNGQQVLKQIRLNPDTAHLPVIVVSSTTSMDEVRECEELGISHFYRKPGNFGQFKKIVEEISSRWLEQ